MTPKRLTVLVGALFTPLLVGCAPSLDPSLLLTAEELAQLETAMPKELPSGLEYVSDHSEEFDVGDAGLFVPAEFQRVSSLDQLDGCWGRVSDQIELNPIDSSIEETTRVEVLRFDVPGNRLYHERIRILRNKFGGQKSPDNDFTIWEDSLSFDGEGRFSRTVLDGHAGALSQDGEIVFSYWAIAGMSSSIGHSWVTVAYVTEDRLCTDEGSIDTTIGQFSNIRIWRRFDCKP